MGFRKDYVEEVTKTIMMMNPKLNKLEVEDIVHQIVKERICDPSIVMDNNVTGDNHTIKLSEMCNWIEKRNPVVSGNATFYCQPSELLSPTSNMLRSLKKGRKKVKKEMFSLKAGSDEYAMKDLEQQNIKVVMNAEYGGSGAPTAAFYTKYSPAATTLMAQSIITTMAAFFESYVGDNQKFFNNNECFDWLNHVCKKDEKIPKWVKRPTAEDVYRRITKHFYILDKNILPCLKDYIDNRTSDQLVYLYYANNIKEFVRNHGNIQQLLINVLSKIPNYEAAIKDIPEQFRTKFPWDSEGKYIVDYNKWISKEMFLNPYDIPDVIKDDMEEFISLMTQFIYVEYITPDSIVKLNNHKRNTVLLVDTDSNMINADLFVSFVLNEIVAGDTFGRKKMYNEMILVNVLAASLDRSVAKILDYYGRCHRMDEESRAELTMKNEFMFRRFFLMRTKKRYAASIVLREGNIIIPFKPEIKGVDFIKAGVTDEVESKFKNMLQNHILYSDDLELHELMTELKQFEREIFDDLKNGGVTFLKQQQFKAEGGYKNIAKAWSLPVFRGSMVWNELFPDKKIYSLDRVRILKTIVTDQKDLERVKEKYPEDYNEVIAKIYMSDYDEIRRSGLKYICIPNSVKEIPKWMIQITDFDVIISDVISSFKSVLEALRIEDIDFKTPNGKASLTSCLISM